MRKSLIFSSAAAAVVAGIVGADSVIKYIDSNTITTRNCGLQAVHVNDGEGEHIKLYPYVRIRRPGHYDAFLQLRDQDKNASWARPIIQEWVKVQQKARDNPELLKTYPNADDHLCRGNIVARQYTGQKPQL